MSRYKEMLKVAKARLDTLDYYPNSVDISGVRVIVFPLFFELLFPRFDGYCIGKKTILMRYSDFSDDLLTHELCHCWQIQQHGRLKTGWAYFRNKYLENPYEIQARMAVEETSANRS